MAKARRHPTDDAGSRFFGRHRADLEPLPMAGPVGVNPDLWAHAVVTDRGLAVWLRLTLSELARAHPGAAVGLGLTGGGAGLALLGRLVGFG